MAGTIIVSRGVVWSAGTIAFVNIAERTRSLLNAEEATVLELAYLPLAEGIDIIALDELDKNSFQLFYRKCKDAFELYHHKTSEADEGVVECWEDFLRLLGDDERIESGRCS